ncbi:unnamed protein product [Schistocephalus solidus]|uniref:Sulfotransfer_1 domain-containing protein n=1 Tax=Schistocephalus solidus TaxID=70667 RepID=A0A183SJN6_SCHSO|nr:unnamed protein product [Schistocephalus solidus]
MAARKQVRKENATESMIFIGAGMMRTGTRSLQTALEKLYGEACYHTFDSMQHTPQDLQFWVESLDDMEGGVLRTDAAYWNRLLQGYCGTTDFPGSVFFKELMQAYPNAKVILTTRDPDAWVKSMRATVFPLDFYKSHGVFLNFVLWLKGITGILQIVDQGLRLSLRRSQDDLMNDVQLRQAFLEWTAHVKKTVPSERLLIFNAQEGWGPLCHFLHRPIPDCPFPHVNASKEMKRYMLFDRPLIFTFKFVLPTAFCTWLFYVTARRVTGKSSISEMLHVLRMGIFGNY